MLEIPKRRFLLSLSQEGDDELLIVGNGEVRMRTQGGAEYARMFSHPGIASNASGICLASALRDRARMPSLATCDSLKEDCSGEELLGGGGVGSVSGRGSIGSGRVRKSTGSGEGVGTYFQSDRRTKQVGINCC